jgi:uncharacterized protein
MNEIKKRRILIEIAHPAQVHQFRLLAGELNARGYRVLFAAQEKEFIRYLLDHYKLDYRIISRSRKGLARKLLQLPVIYFRFAALLLTFRPHLILSRFMLQSSHLAWLFRIPVIGFTDTEHVRMMLALTTPFIGTKMTADTFTTKLGKNHFRYPGNIELFYLHPNRFHPDPTIYNMLGIPHGAPYALLRFVSWNAYHDVHQRGISLDEKRELVEFLRQHMHVFISAEGEIPEDLDRYRVPTPPERIHDVLVFASLYAGEGASMASEAAMLGVPTVYVNTLEVGYVEDAARRGMLYSFRDTRGMMEKVKELVLDAGSAQRHRDRAREYVCSTIDPTGFVLWLVEHYPDSIAKLKSEPDFIKHFIPSGATEPGDPEQ